MLIGTFGSPCHCHWVLFVNDCIIVTFFDSCLKVNYLFTDCWKTIIMHCPFLSKLSSHYVRNYGSTLVKTYSQFCPVMSSVSKIHISATDSPTTTDVKDEKKCPFLAEMQKSPSLVTEASSEIQEDVIRVQDQNGEFFLIRFIQLMAMDRALKP